MAVTVKIEDKTRAKPKRGAKINPEAGGFDAYALPADRKNGQIALGVWIALLALICLPWWFSEATLPFAIGLPLWCLGAALGVLFVAPALTARRLRAAGKTAQISATNQPQIKALLVKGSNILGLDEPEAFLEDRAAPRVRVMPRTVILHQHTFAALNANEISALVVRALVHLRQGHARRLALLYFIETTQPPLVLCLVWPVLIYDRLLRALWLPHAQQNADRLALFLVKNHDLMLAAIIKEHAASDANMQQLQVAGGDVDTWIHQRGHIGGSGEEISTQYKLGRAIHENPPLEARLQNLQNWSKSSEFSAGLEKLKSSR